MALPAVPSLREITINPARGPRGETRAGWEALEQMKVAWVWGAAIKIRSDQILNFKEKTIFADRLSAVREKEESERLHGPQVLI